MDDCPSAPLVEKMQRLFKTGHPSRLFPDFVAADVAANFRTSHVQIGWQHPVLRFKDVLTCLSENNKMEHVVKDTSLKVYAEFWEKFKQLQPDHPIHSLSKERQQHTLPLLLHADEGTSQKKRGIMVMSVQPVIGDGTRLGGHGVNYLGNSLCTRFLFTAIMARCYRKKHSKRLKTLVDWWANDLKDLFENPVSVSWSP